jgi:hypothetical protein
MFVDDQLIAGNNEEVTDDFVNFLRSKFRKITDYGLMNKYIGVQSHLNHVTNHLESHMADLLNVY